MTLYIGQLSPHVQTRVWEADDEADAIEKVQAVGYDRDFDTAEDAVAHDQQRSLVETCPAHLVSSINTWLSLYDATLRRWGRDQEAEVDLGDLDEWGEGTDGAARLSHFQCDLADLDGAEIGRVGDYDVIYLPDARRGARVSNGDAEWFDANSFRHASLFAQGDWDGDTGK